MKQTKVTLMEQGDNKGKNAHKNTEVKPVQKEGVFSPDDVGTVIHEFLAPEYLPHNRGSTWFFGMGIAVLVGVLFGIFQGSLSLILVSVMIGAIYTLTHKNNPKKVVVQFTEMGMVYDTSFFLYQDITSFWIFWEPGEVKTLHVLLAKGFLKELVIPIETQKMEVIRDTLGYYVPEVEGVEEPFSQFLSRKLKL